MQPGTHAAWLGGLAVVVAAAAALSGLRAALAYTLLSALAVLALHAAERAHLLAGAAAVADGPDFLRLCAQGSVVPGGLLIGCLLQREYRFMAQAVPRERERFRAVLRAALPTGTGNRTSSSVSPTSGPKRRAAAACRSSGSWAGRAGRSRTKHPG